MSGDHFDHIGREIERIERDMRRAGVYRAQDALNQVPSAMEGIASVQRAVAGLDHKKITSAVMAASVPRASLGGLGVHGTAIQDALKAADEARSALRSVRVINPGSIGFGIASRAAMAGNVPISASRQIAGIEKAMKVARGATFAVAAAGIDTSAMREAISAATSARGIVADLSAAHTALYSLRGQQGLFHDILESAKRQGALGPDVTARFLSGGPVRSSVAFRSTIRAATGYGPIVVTPDAPPPPPPRQQPSSHYTPNLQATSAIPNTAADPNAPIAFDAVWVIVMGFAHAIAQHRRTQVLVRWVGKNRDGIIIGLAITYGPRVVEWIWIALT